LKQGQYQPMDVAEQVIVIFAGTNGYLDDIPVEAVQKFEREFLEFVRAEHSDVLKEIKEKGEISKELDQKIRQVIEKFKEKFEY